MTQYRWIDPSDGEGWCVVPDGIDWGIDDLTASCLAEEHYGREPTDWSIDNDEAAALELRKDPFSEATRFTIATESAVNFTANADC